MIFNIDIETKKELIEASRDLSLNDSVIYNVKIINVFNGNIEEGIVYIKGAYITHVDYNNKKMPVNIKNLYDGKGSFLSPGFIDSHTHIESSMLTPRNFADMVIPYGTTTVITDPHEIANVFGLDGIDYMLKNGENLPMRQLITFPSSVPSVEGLENSGATLYAKDISKLIKKDKVVGLAEMMDYEGVINCNQNVLEKIEAVEHEGKYVQGHAPRVSGTNLSAYLLGGPISDHESSSINEIKEKHAKGMYIDLRDSNTNKNLEEFIKKIKEFKYKDRFTFCTDDRRCNVTIKEGHINALIRKAIASGLDPVDAIRIATLNAAQEAKLSKLGAIAPGYIADLVIINSLKYITIESVFFEGNLVYNNGSKNYNIPKEHFPIETVNSINISKDFSEKDFIIEVSKENKNSVDMNYIEYESFYSSFTILKRENFIIDNGRISIHNKKDMMFAAVINRHGYDTHSLAVVKNFGITRGALASTVSHDSHNITIVFDTPKNALKALNKLVEQRGGIVAVENNKVIASLPLEVGGLMSNQNAETVIKNIDKMTLANKKLGNHYLENPISRITILSLLASPRTKLSDLGIIDTVNQKIVPIFD